MSSIGKLSRFSPVLREAVECTAVCVASPVATESLSAQWDWLQNSRLVQALFVGDASVRQARSSLIIGLRGSD